MSTPDTEARLRVLEAVARTHSTLLTALQGRVAELSTSAPASEEQGERHLYAVSYRHMTHYLCRERITNAAEEFPGASVTWLGTAHCQVKIGWLGSRRIDHNEEW
jgi:hypothetical protein